MALNALSQVVGGGISVARDLADAMARERPGTRFALFCVADELRRHRFADNVEVFHRPDLAGFPRRTCWEQLTFPGILREAGYDALLTLGGFAVFRSPVPQVSVWQNPNIFTRVPVPRPFHVDAYIRLQRTIQGFSMQRADLNVFLTRQSLEEASTRWNMDRIPHVVIPNGVSVLPRGVDAEEHSGEPFVLAVGHSYFHFLRTVWRTTVLGKPGIYRGAEPPGWKEWLALPTHVAAARQWKALVTWSLRDGRALPADRYMELRFEELLAEPERRLREVLEFTSLRDADGFFEAAVRRVDGRKVKEWTTTLTPEQEDEVARELEPLLSELGYTRGEGELERANVR